MENQCSDDDLTDIIKIIKEEGVDHVQLNTNGIKLALSPETMRQVRSAGVSNLHLSFDGVTPRTNPKNHWEVPYTLESARKCGTTVVFVPTVIKSINDHELGASSDLRRRIWMWFTQLTSSQFH